MKFKSNYINNVVGAHDKYLKTLINIDKKKAELKDYKEEVILEKIKEFVKANANTKEGYRSEINRLRESELNKLEGEYSKLISGASITDDIKLFNTPGIELTEKEVQKLADKYSKEGNLLMIRAINAYTDKKGMKINYSLNNPIDKKIETVKTISEYAINYMDLETQMALVQGSIFKSLDVILG